MFQRFLPLAVLAVQLVQGRPETWYSSSYVTEYYSSTTVVSYGKSAVTPVPTSSAFDLATSYIDVPPASSDVTAVVWATVTVTEDFFTQYVVVTDNRLPGHTVTSNTSTFEVWTSPTLATITLSTTTCIKGASPARTETRYTGKYSPVPGQVTTVPTTWPTAVISVWNDTAVYRRYTYIGTTTTTTSTETWGTYLSTTTVTTSVPPGNGRHPITTYLTTVTVTSSDWQLAYTTKTISFDCARSPTPTVTRAAQCAPTNMISERDGYGVAVEILPDSWRFPIEFPGEIIGIPGMDAGACCQLCLDNQGEEGKCAASEWTVEGTANPAGCTLYYYGFGNSTCGGELKLRYYATTWKLPGQRSYVQVGCGGLEYMGVHSDLM